MDNFGITFPTTAFIRTDTNFLRTQFNLLQKMSNKSNLHLREIERHLRSMSRHSDAIPRSEHFLDMYLFAVSLAFSLKDNPNPVVKL